MFRKGLGNLKLSFSYEDYSFREVIEMEKKVKYLGK